MTGKFRNTLLECIDIALMMEVALLFYSQIDLFSSSILFICLIKDKPHKLQEQGLLIKMDVLKKTMVMLFLLSMIGCSMVRIEEEERKLSRIG